MPASSPLISTGLANALLGSQSLKDALAGGKICIYSGSAPTSADAAATGTLLCAVTLGSSPSSGITLDDASDGTIAKPAADTWSGVNLAAGQASYFRWTTLADDGSLSATVPRIQGLVSTSGAHLNMTSINLVQGETTTLNAASVSF